MDLKIIMVPRVTIKGGIFTLPISRPLMLPQTKPANRENSRVRIGLLVALKTTTEKPPMSATMLPTDRSIPPVMMARPMPMAMVPTTVECLRMFITPLQVVAPPLTHK